MPEMQIGKDLALWFHRGEGKKNNPGLVKY